MPLNPEIFQNIYWQYFCQMYIMAKHSVLEEIMYKYLTSVVLITFVFSSCSSSPEPSKPKLDINSFQENQTYRDKFTGIWTQNTFDSGNYDIFEFRNDGTGQLTRYRNNIVSNTSSFRYKTSDFQIIMHFARTDYTNRANYVFINNSALSLVGWYNGTPNETYNRSGSSRGNTVNNDINTTLKKAADTLLQSIPKEFRIAIINISSNDNEVSDFVAAELEFLLVNNGFFVVDRGQLDRIRQEQNFQLSGDVDDNSAVSIGKFSGANIVVLGSISGSGDMRRLRFRALDTETARVVGSASEAF
jgi:PBP1b-binding outer membrane lipoprotein LpoB